MKGHGAYGPRGHPGWWVPDFYKVIGDVFVVVACHPNPLGSLLPIGRPIPLPLPLLLLRAVEYICNFLSKLGLGHVELLCQNVLGVLSLNLKVRLHLKSHSCSFLPGLHPAILILLLLKALTEQLM